MHHCLYLPFDGLLLIESLGISLICLDRHQSTVWLRDGYERLVAIRYDVLSDGVVARQVPGI